jgi:hypothetical protein
VSTRNSYVEWYRRAGRLRASLLVCDRHANVIAAVDLRSSRESEREQGRHSRVVRVLQSAGVDVMVWNEGELPSASHVRQRLAPLLKEEARPETAELAPDMSGPVESMGIEGTDFAALDTMPAPLEERGTTGAGRHPRPA